MSNDIRYLTPINIDIKKEKYCRFKKSGIKFIDYKTIFSSVELEKTKAKTENNKLNPFELGCAGGPVVTAPVYCSEDPSSNHAGY